MKNHSIILVMALMAAANARGEMGAGTITSSTKELNGGMVYTVQGNVTLSGATSTSALTVKPNSGDNGKRVVIDIPEGCSLTVTGGNAGNVGGRIGAGAGIELPGDMTLYITGKGKLTARGVRCVVPDRLPAGSYPDDVALNCFVVGNFAFGRRDSASPELLEFLRAQDIEFVDVKQGYARCSVAVVDEHSLITADRGLHRAMTAAGFDVLLIQTGGIVLEGYDTGFIGGCCGKLSADRILFCGDPLHHPDGEGIIDFLSERGVSAESTHDGQLVDFGGFITVFE